MYTQSNSGPKVVTLVPFTSNEPSRIIAWDAVQIWWHNNVGLPLFVGESDPSAFNISLARNRAAKKAKNWDIAVILDADTLISQKQIKEGVSLALSTGAVIYPYTERWELSDVGTKKFLVNSKSNWHQYAKRHAYEHFGGCIIVTRKLWDTVRGFDPKFVGWGHEDGAFLAACTILSNQQCKRVSGKLFHLDHNPSPEKSPLHPQYIANRKRMTRYTEAIRQPNAKELILELRDESNNIV